jgi:hypothetical protein
MHFRGRAARPWTRRLRSRTLVSGAAGTRGGGEGRGMTEQEWLDCTDPE